MKLFAKKQTHKERHAIVAQAVVDVLVQEGWEELSEFTSNVAENCGNANYPSHIYIHNRFFKKENIILAVAPILMEHNKDYFLLSHWALGATAREVVSECEVVVLTNHFRFPHGDFPYIFEQGIHLVNFARPEKGANVNAEDVRFAMARCLEMRQA